MSKPQANDIRSLALSLFGGFIIDRARMAVEIAKQRLENPRDEAHRETLLTVMRWFDLFSSQAEESKAEDLLVEKLGQLPAAAAMSACSILQKASMGMVIGAYRAQLDAEQREMHTNSGDTERPLAPTEPYAGNTEERPAYPVLADLAEMLHVQLALVHHHAQVAMFGQPTAFNRWRFQEFPVGWIGDDQAAAPTPYHSLDEYLAAYLRQRELNAERRVIEMQEARKGDAFNFG